MLIYSVYISPLVIFLCIILALTLLFSDGSEVFIACEILLLALITLLLFLAPNYPVLRPALEPCVTLTMFGACG